MRKIKSIGLSVVLGLALAMAAAPIAASGHARRSAAAKARRAAAAAAAEPVFVLKAGGQTVPNGALVNVAGAGKPEYLFKTHVLIQETPAPAEYELECENYLEQGTIERNLSTDTWRIVNVHPVEICEGAPWLEEGFSENRLTLSPGGISSDDSTVEMFRTEEAIRTEERKQAEKGEPVNPHEPRRCAFTTVISKGKYTRNAKKPLVVKVKNKMVGKSLAIGKGCVTKATWHGSFTLSYKGQPIFPGSETPPAPPAVSNLNPTEGPEGGGTSVQISGSGFSGATAVKFGSTSATSFKVNSPESITAVAPTGSGSVEVTVTTPVSTSTSGDMFAYRPVPTVTLVTPKIGPESGGTEVTITGTNFTSASKVSFGSTPASSVTVNSAESITAVSPAGTGTVHVTVTTAGGTSATSAGDEFTY